MEIWIILIVIVSIIVMGYLFFNRTAKMIREVTLEVRYDDNDTLHYFRHTDFENMNQEEYEFISNGYKLKGYKYFNSTVSTKDSPLIFVHGLGAGHIQYTTEINYFVNLGYEVYTFDGQGCLSSEGEGLKYFSNYVKNLDDFLAFLEKDLLKDKKYILIGHSMGAHSVLASLKFHEENISKVVALSPYISIKTLLNDQIGRNIKNIGPIITNFMVRNEKKVNPQYCLNVSDIIKNTEKDILIGFGELDEVLSIQNNYEFLKNEHSKKDNVYFMLSKNRFHRPLLSKDAAEYDLKRTIEFNRIKKIASPEEMKQHYEGLDYKLLVKMDEDIIKFISDFINDKKPETKETIMG